jgi:hypothetical protein
LLKNNGSMKRQKRFVTKSAWSAVLTVLVLVANAQGPTPAPLVVHPLRGNVSWVEGGGGNSGVIVGNPGVIVVDAKITPASGKALLDDIAKVTPKPVNTMILTHSDSALWEMLDQLRVETVGPSRRLRKLCIGSLQRSK